MVPYQFLDRKPVPGVIDQIKKTLIGQEDCQNLKNFCQYAAMPGGVPVKEDEKFFMMIIDSYHSKSNTQDEKATKEALFEYFQPISQKKQDSNSIYPNLIFKVKELHNLGIAEVTSIKIYHLPYHPYSIRAEHSAWIKRLIELNPWFIIAKGELEQLKNALLIPICDKFLKKHKMLADFTIKKVFSDFTKYLEIFLNEIRKYAIVMHARTATSFHFDPPTMEELDQKDRISMSIASKRSSISLEPLSPMVTDLSTSRRVSKMIDKRKHLLFVQALVGASNDPSSPGLPRRGNASTKDEELLHILECMYVQSLMLSIGSVIKEKFKPSFEVALVNNIHSYSQSRSVRFGMDLLNFIAKGQETDPNFTLFNYYFDMASGKWVPFQDFSSNIDEEMNPSFTVEEFSLPEKSRFAGKPHAGSKSRYFNTMNQMIKNQASTTRLEHSHNPYFFASAAKKKALYVVEHLITYGNNVLLLASPQQGKSVFLEYLSTKFDTVRVSINGHITKQQLLNKVVNSLSNKNNMLMPSVQKLVVCIEDIHLQNEQTNPLGTMRQVFQLNGAYTQDGFKFISDTSFILTSSIGHSNHTIEHFNYSNSPVVFFMQNETKESLTGIFKVNSSLSVVHRAIPQETLKEYKDFVKQLLNFTQFNWDHLLKFQNLFKLNLSFSKILNHLRTLHPSFWPLSQEPQETQYRLSSALFPLFQQNLEDLHTSFNSIFGHNFLHLDASPKRQEQEQEQPISSIQSHLDSASSVEQFQPAFSTSRKSSHTLGLSNRKSSNISYGRLSDELKSEKSQRRKPEVPQLFLRQSSLHSQTQTDAQKKRVQALETSMESHEKAFSSNEEFTDAVSLKTFSTIYLAKLMNQSRQLPLLINECLFDAKEDVKFRAISSKEALMETLGALRQKLKQFTDENVTTGRRLLYYFYYFPETIYQLLLITYVFQAYQSSHFLIKDMLDPLMSDDFIAFGIFSVRAKLIRVIPRQTHVEQCRNLLHKAIQETIMDMSENENNYYIIVDLNNLKDVHKAYQILQDIHSLVHDETINCILGRQRILRIVERWKKLPNFTNYSYHEILMAISQKIRKCLKIILIPIVNNQAKGEIMRKGSGHEILHKEFSHMINKMFMLDLSFKEKAFTGLDKDDIHLSGKKTFELDVKVRDLFSEPITKAFERLDFVERKIQAQNQDTLCGYSSHTNRLISYELYTSLQNYFQDPLKMILEEDGNLSSSTSSSIKKLNEILNLPSPKLEQELIPKDDRIPELLKDLPPLKKCLILSCLRFKKLQIGHDNNLKESQISQILSLVVLYASNVAKYSYWIKEKALQRINNHLELALNGSISSCLENSKTVKHCLDILPIPGFTSDSLYNDIFSLKMLTKFTKAPVICVLDPYEQLSQTEDHLKKFLNNEEITLIESLKDYNINKPNKLKKKGIFVIRDCTNSEFESSLEELMQKLIKIYVDNVLDHLLVPNKMDKNKLKEYKKASEDMTEEDNHANFRFILIFTKVPSFYSKIPTGAAWINLDVSDSSTYQECLTSKILHESLPAEQEPYYSLTEGFNKHLLSDWLKQLLDDLKNGSNAANDQLNLVKTAVKKLQQDVENLNPEDIQKKEEDKPKNVKDYCREIAQTLEIIRKTLKEALTRKSGQEGFVEKAYLDVVTRGLEELKQQDLHIQTDDLAINDEYKKELINYVLDNVSRWLDSDTRKAFMTYLSLQKVKNENILVWNLIKESNPLALTIEFKTPLMAVAWDNFSGLVSKDRTLSQIPSLLEFAHSFIKTSKKEIEKETSPVLQINLCVNEEKKEERRPSIQQRLEFQEDPVEPEEQEQAKKVVQRRGAQYLTESPRSKDNFGSVKLLRQESKPTKAPQIRVVVPSIDAFGTFSAAVAAENLSQDKLKSGSNEKFSDNKLKIISTEKLSINKLKHSATEKVDLLKSGLKSEPMKGQTQHSSSLLTPKGGHLSLPPKRASPRTSTLNQGKKLTLELTEHTPLMAQRRPTNMSSNSDFSHLLDRTEGEAGEEEEIELEKLYNDFSYSNIFNRPIQALIEVRSKVHGRFTHPRILQMSQSDKNLVSIHCLQYYEQILLPYLQNLNQTNPEIFQEVLDALKNISEEFTRSLSENSLNAFNLLRDESQMPVPLMLLLFKYVRFDLISIFTKQLNTRCLTPDATQSSTLETLLYNLNDMLCTIVLYNEQHFYITDTIKSLAHNFEQEMVRISFIKVTLQEIQTSILKCLMEGRWILIEGLCPIYKHKMDALLDFIGSLRRMDFLNKSRIIILTHTSYAPELSRRTLRNVDMIHIDSLSSIKEMLASLYLPDITECLIKSKSYKTKLKWFKKPGMEKSNNLRTLLPLMKFLGHKGRSPPQDYTISVLRQRVESNQSNLKGELSSSQFMLEKHVFALSFAVSVFYKQLSIFTSIEEHNVLPFSFQDISTLVKQVSKTLTQYEYNPIIIVTRLAEKLLDMNLEGSTVQKSRMNQAFSVLLEEFASDKMPYPLRLQVADAKYNFFAPTSYSRGLKKGPLVVSALGVYPEEDPFELMGMDSSVKMVADFETSRKLFEKILVFEDALNKKERHKEDLAQDFDHLFDFENQYSLSQKHKKLQRLLHFARKLERILKGLPEIVDTKKLEEISKDLPKTDSKVKKLMHSPTNADIKKIDMRKRSLFAGLASGDARKLSPPPMKQAEMPWLREYFLKDGKCLTKLFTKMKKDLLDLIEKVESGTENVAVLEELAYKNKIPEAWRQGIVFPWKTEGLNHSMKHLLLKYDYIYSIVNESKDIQSQPTDLGQILDPIDFIYTMMHGFCGRNEVQIDEVEVDLVIGRYSKRMGPKENEERMIVKGLSVCFASFDAQQGTLEEAKAFEFMTKLPEFTLRFTKKRASQSEDTRPPEIGKDVLIRVKDWIQVNREEKQVEEISDSENEESVVSEEQSTIGLVIIPFRQLNPEEGKVRFSNGKTLWFGFQSRISQEKWDCKGAFIDI